MLEVRPAYVPLVWSPLAYSRNIVLRIINLAIDVIEFLLALRILLSFLGANPGNSFMAWLYGATGGLLAPFAGIFPALSLGGFVIDWSVVFAMFAYAILGWLLAQVVWFVTDTLLRMDTSI